MKNKNIAILAFLVASFALAACSQGGSSLSGATALADSDPTTVQALANQFVSSSSSDIQNSTATGGVTTTQGVLPFAYAGVAISDSAGGAKSCVTLNVKSDTTSDFDVVWTFACPTETGTVELSRVTNTSGTTNTLDTDLKQIYLAGSLTNDTDDSLVATKSAAGLLTLTKQFDDTFTSGSNTYVSDGQANDSFTPDSAANPSAGGDVVLSSSLQLSKNAAVLNTFTVTSNDLHILSCGFNSGSIELKSNTDDVVITYTACGQFSITDNGKLIFPLPNPAPSPSPSTPIIDPLPTPTPPCGVSCQPGHACPQYCISGGL